MAPPTFSHLAISCRDPLALERFYTRHFGFERARVIPLGSTQIVFLRAGNVYLELFAAEGEPPGPPAKLDGPTYPGLRHLAFKVADVDAVLAEVGRDARVTLGPLSFDEFIPGWRSVWVADPEGNIVEISQGYTDQEKPPPLG
ncbi:MAG: VOC family protein [Candidatus Latescibacterota bacterium]